MIHKLIIIENKYKELSNNQFMEEIKQTAKGCKSKNIKYSELAVLLNKERNN